MARTAEQYLDGVWWLRGFADAGAVVSRYGARYALNLAIESMCPGSEYARGFADAILAAF